jgi:hypothetical protein
MLTILDSNFNFIIHRHDPRFFNLSIICALLILSLFSISWQIVGITGCDHVRIHFKALNDNGIYFKDDPYVGLGLYNHQVFTEKDTRDWVFDSTCKKYDSLESDMFLEGNLKTTAALSFGSIVINGMLVLFLVFRAVTSILRGRVVLLESKRTSAICSIAVSVLSATSLALQAVAIDKIHDEGGICDRDSYFPDEWNAKFPFQLYPSYAYFKYFHECKVGPDGNRVKMSIMFSALVCAIATAHALVMLLQIPRDQSGGRRIMASFPVKTLRKKEENRSEVFYAGDESNLQNGEFTSTDDATVSIEYDEESVDML